MIDRETCCAFTGHRPEKLNISEAEARRLLCAAIEKAINDGYTTFITGMAKGVDVWSGEIVLEFKELYPQIKLVCALPFPGFAKNAPHLIEKADFVHTVMNGYSVIAFQRRNEWMVDNCSLLIALYNGEKGGTLNTLNYAEGCGVEIIRIQKPPLFKQLTF